MNIYILLILVFCFIVVLKMVYLIMFGDLCELVNVVGWLIQVELEIGVSGVLNVFGWEVICFFGVDFEIGYGFILSQCMGFEVFWNILVDVLLVVVIVNWQYLYYVFVGLCMYEGLIFMVVNFVGDWLGFVGLFGFNVGLMKMDKLYVMIWLVDFIDDWFCDGICEWIEIGFIIYDVLYVCLFFVLLDSLEKQFGEVFVVELKLEKVIIGVFDEGCMGMYNVIFDDEFLNEIGIYKECLLQLVFYVEMLNVIEEEVDVVYDWFVEWGMMFWYGEDVVMEFICEQVQWQLKMYIVVFCIVDDFGFDVVGIQYQQGLKDLVFVLDLVEGIFNFIECLLVILCDGFCVLYEGWVFLYFNEVDEGVVVDVLVIDWVWCVMGFVFDNMLYDVCWGEDYDGQFVWVYEIFGLVLVLYFGGWQNVEGWWQGYVFFFVGGVMINGVFKFGEVVFLCVFIVEGVLQVDIFWVLVVELFVEEMQCCKDVMNLEWLIVYVVLYGIFCDQFMVWYKVNYVQFVYVFDVEIVDKVLIVKVVMFDGMGIKVNFVGDVVI